MVLLLTVGSLVGVAYLARIIAEDKHLAIALVAAGCSLSELDQAALQQLPHYELGELWFSSPRSLLLFWHDSA